jgi:CheY-like chemotaxis protein
MKAEETVDAAKILIVEDHATVAEDCRDCLENLGYRVTDVVASGEEAVEAAERDRPDIVLMDIRLRGEMDGIQAAERIRDLLGIPVLFLSAYSDRTLLRRARQVGSFGYLVKPFQENELFAMLEMTLFRAKAEMERRAMEARLRQARKAEAVGRLAGGVAHHFNNMLAVVIGYLEMARDNVAPDAEFFPNLVEAEKAAHRAAEMSLLMLSCLGQRPGKPEILDLSETVSNHLEALPKNEDQRALPETNLPRPGPTVRADRAEMGQILNALLDNARESMDRHASGRILASVETAAASEIGETHRFPADWEGSEPAYACLSVADQGKGMDPETIDGIFDPFFSDKFVGRGLGLALVLGIVKAHGGCVAVESRPGRGSVFRVFLPLAGAAASPPPPRKKNNPSRALSGAVLVVDDEPMVRNVLQSMLERLGYEVTAAEDGAEAAKIFRENPEGFGLVISDLSMPGMDGRETLAALRKIRPDIPTILASGYDEARVLAKTRGEPPGAFLHKPFRMEALKETVERVLGHAAP